MKALARGALKTMLFVGLLTLSVRYVQTYPQPMPASQLAVLLRICETLGIRDPDDLYIPAMMVVELAVAIGAYAGLMWLWRRHRAPR